MTAFNEGLSLRRLYERLMPAAKDRRIADLRIGLSYAGVLMDNGAAGLAAVLPDSPPRGCTVLQGAGTFAGSSASDVLQYLVHGKNALHRAMGVAAANALAGSPGKPAEDREATTYFDLKPGENVAMVGLFAPLVERIRKTGAKLTVIEKILNASICCPRKTGAGRWANAMSPSSRPRRCSTAPLKKRSAFWERRASSR